MVWFRLKKASRPENEGQLGRGGRKAVTIVSTTEQAVDRARMKLKHGPGPVRAKAAKTKKKKGPIKRGAKKKAKKSF